MNLEQKDLNMSNSRCLAVAKVVAILGFAVLLSSTYFLRTEVLKLNEIRFSADETRSKYEIEQSEKDYPYEQERFEATKKTLAASFARAKQRYESGKQNHQRTLARNDARLAAARSSRSRASMMMRCSLLALSKRLGMRVRSNMRVFRRRSWM